MNSELQTKLSELPRGYESLEKSIGEQGKKWHDEVDIIINKTLTKAKQIQEEDFAMLLKFQSDMNEQLSKIRQIIQENMNFLKSNDGMEIMNGVPPSFELSLPTFSSEKIQSEELLQKFGIIQPSIKKEILGYAIHGAEESSLPNKQFLDKVIVNNIKTGSYTISGVCCVPNTEQCITVSYQQMKRIDKNGTTYETVSTKSGNWIDIKLTVTREGNLVYSDFYDRSINKLQDGKIHTIIRLWGWYPCDVCSTSSDDLLVIMRTEEKRRHSKIVRYAGSIVTQEIQFDDQHKPLYLYPAFVEENTNLQVCVSDKDSVVVTDKAGKLMFRYNGNLSSKKYKSFRPEGLATDSMCHILVADFDNECIHIITHEGRFLRYINHRDLDVPLGLSVSSDDILYIADLTPKLKMIKYFH